MSIRILNFKLLAVIFLFCFVNVYSQSSGSCFSKTGTLGANIQVSFADKVDEPVLFDAGNSTGVGDFANEPIEWDFGDGFKAKMCRASHAYRNPGTYTVTLKVKNNQGSISTATTNVTVSSIPSATGNNVLTVVTNGSGNGVTTFNNIQSAVNKAAAINNTGTVEIIIPAGGVFAENIELKVPVGNNYITLKSSALANLPVGQRVNRTNLSNFPTIKPPFINDNIPAIRTELKSPTSGACTENQTCLPAHHYRLQGIQFTADPNTFPGGLFETILEFGTDAPIQNEISEQAHHFIMDRCLVYREDYSASNPNPQAIKNGLEANGTHISVLDSHFSGINAPGSETHGMTAYNSTGIWSVVNNYFEAGTINFFIGGARPSIPSAFVTDVEFRRNRCHKPIEKRSLPYAHKWPAKINFEIKSGRYWVIDENMFDTNWQGWDQRYLVSFTAFLDTNEVPTNRDMQFSNNVVKQGPNGILIGRDPMPGYDHPNLYTRFLITHNLFTEIGGPAYNFPYCFNQNQTPQWQPCQTTGDDASEGTGFLITTVPTNVVIRHNTSYNRKGIMVLSGSTAAPLIFKDNIVNHGTSPYADGYGYGIIGDDSSRGCWTIDPTLPDCVLPSDPSVRTYLPGSILRKNVIAGIDFDSRFPTNNIPYPNVSDNFYFPTNNPANPSGYANIDNHFVNRAGGNYRLANGSPGKNAATDGTDVGADIDKIDQVTANTVTGIWGTSSQTPYPGPNAPSLLSTIEVENYDNGGAGIAYNDLTPGNEGSNTPPVYRANDVDTFPYANASNGQVVNSAQAGEWLEYTVSVPASGLYNFAVRYSSGYALANSKGKFRLEVCDPTTGGGYTNCVLTPDVTVYATGGWGTFQTVNVPLKITSAGTKVLRMVMRTNAPGDTNCNCVVANFDAVTVTNERSLFDYDNDRKADVSLFRPSDATWYLLQSTNGFGAVQFGVSTDTAVSADYDGDGKTDIAVYRASNGTWWILRSSNLSVVSAQFGSAGDMPVQGDYTGDGKADIAVWRPSTGDWLILRSEDGSFYSVPFGTTGDIPAPGDYDGDGKFDPGVFRPSTGNWYLQQSLGGFVGASFGLSGDKVTPADYDGDGKTDVAVFRPSTATWWILNSATLQTSAANFGLGTDIPTPADFDGDGKADVAVFRPSDGSWYLSQSTNGFLGVAFGTNGDVPAPSTYVR